MKINKNFALASVLILIAFFSAGCKKEQSKGLEDPNAVQEIVQNWLSEFVKGASKKEVSSGHAIVKDLDYALAYQVDSEAGKSMLLVTMKSKTAKGSRKFLSLTKKGNLYEIDGIYEASDISNIRSFFSKQTFHPNDSIIVRSVLNNPVKAWVTDDAGKVSYKQGFSVTKGQDPKEAFLKQQRSDLGGQNRRTDNAPNPDGPCIAWYWILYDPETGAIISVDFLYTTGDCGDGGSGGGGGNPPQNCENVYDQQLADYYSEVDDGEGLSLSENAINVAETNATVQTKPWAEHWVCFQGFGGWTLNSYESGTIKRIDSASVTNPSRHWAFKNISHVAILMDGSPAWGTSIAYTQGIGTPSFTPENATLYNYLSATMQVTFSVTYTFKPVGNCPILSDLIEVINRPVTKTYSSLGAWALYD